MCVRAVKRAREGEIKRLSKKNICICMYAYRESRKCAICMQGVPLWLGAASQGHEGSANRAMGRLQGIARHGGRWVLGGGGEMDWWIGSSDVAP